MVIAVVHDLCGLFRIPVVLGEKTHRSALGDIDDNLAHFTGCNGIAVAVKKLHIVLRRGFSHGSQLDLAATEVAHGKRGLGLSEAFADLQAGGLVELCGNLRIQGLSCGCHVTHRGEIVL